MKFTNDQRKVIDTRDKNLLVSAAAGSGKTAVLVERIIGLITDPERQIDVDRLLVVTFTRAAAAEMKERIRDALEALIEKNPEDFLAARQLSLIATANIMTIDSFCVNVTSEHFEEAGIDPMSRVGDEGELKLIQEEAMEAVLGRAYEPFHSQGDGEGGFEGEGLNPVFPRSPGQHDSTESYEEFRQMLERFSTGRDDSDIISAVRRIHRYSITSADPEIYLKKVYDSWDKKEIESHAGDIDSFDFAAEGMNLVKGYICDLSTEIKHAIQLCALPGGPQAYFVSLEDDLSQLEAVLQAESLSKLLESMLQVSFMKLSGKAAKDEDKELREAIKKIRDEIKKKYQDFVKLICPSGPGEIEEALLAASPVVRSLVWLTDEYGKEYWKRKDEKHVLDFYDLEHLALKVLRSPAGAEYREFFEEVMTDEYQDTNSIQEAILKSVARDNNYFCVGDVKQSIYGFRLAKPEIFIGRYDSYLEDPKSERIILAQNFRSRATVLSSVNMVFSEVMKKSCGNIDYDEDAYLRYGGLYTDSESGVEGLDYKTELVLVSKDPEKRESAVETEARYIASRIREMAGVFEVEDRKTNLRRKSSYRDFCILLRKTKDVGDVFKAALEEAGIPAHVESETGYFQSDEIKSIINLLNVIDNPRQDIPLAAVMLGPFSDFTDEELAFIRGSRKDAKEELYDSLLRAAGRKSESEAASCISDALKNKVGSFLDLINGYRDMVPYTTVRDLLERIIEDFDYDLICASRGGMQKANLKLLLKKASDYEKSSFYGLFHFIHYIEKLKRYEIEMGSAEDGDLGDVVRIMTIHKSKGLEFPIVFLGMLDKKYNLRDTSNSIVLDESLGIGAASTDPITRIKKSTIIRTLIAEKMQRLDKGEEIRVLYVGMTRAMEKLIMTASVDEDKKNGLWGKASPYFAGSFLDLINIALMNSTDRDKIRVINVPFTETLEKTVASYSDLTERRESFESLDKLKTYDEDTKNRLETISKFEYPFKALVQVPAKVSVTELKEEEQEEAYEAGERPVNIAPKVIVDETNKIPWNRVGTAYHKAFQHMADREISNIKEAESFIKALAADGYIDSDILQYIKYKDFCVFSSTVLAGRMRNAQKNGDLFCEQPFIIERAARLLKAEWDTDAPVLIQGIIDAFFFEEGEVVLLDYKTDHVKSEELLIERYKRQLDIYEDALHSLTEMRVKEKLIYSVALGKTITVP